MTVNALKSYDVDRLALDELVAMAMFAQDLRAAHEQRGVEVPEYLLDATERLNAEVNRRNRDNLMLRLKQAEQAENALKTPTEKRAELAEQRAKLQRQLGLAPTPAPEPVAQ